MLNVSAKEFVPAASPKAVLATETSVLSKPCDQAIKDAICTVEECSVRNGGGSAPNKPQLSPMAPAFVPRGGKASTDNNCLLDTASDPPRSVLTPPRSDTSGSSSIASPEPDSWAEDGEWYGEEQKETYLGCDGDAQGYYYYYYSGQTEGEQYEDSFGYGNTAVMQSGELSPGEGASGCVYDPYGYGTFDGYTMTYTDAAGINTLGNAVYYDAQYAYDGMEQQLYTQGTYYWDDSAGTYVFSDAGGECASGWPSQSLSQEVHPSFDMAPAGRTTPITWPDVWGVDANVGGDVDEELCLGGGNQLSSLEPSDAAELLEMFFPHYAGEALSRLLQRTGGNLVAAFSELAAMERQVGAERAAAAMASGKGLHPRGGRGGKAQGPAGKRSGGGAGNGGAGHFKLDMESFPALPPSPSPYPAAKDSAPSNRDGRVPDGKSPAVGEAAEASSHATAATASSNTAPRMTTSAASAPETVAGGDGDVGVSLLPKPNFATALRNSHSVPSGSSASPVPWSSEAANGGCSSSAVCRSGSEVLCGSRAARDPTSAAVPWVSTGAAVSALYAEERREAAMLARARNRLFEQATMAYLSGNKALAKQLGRRGRQLNEEMKAAHAAAARRIFAQRNGRAVRHGPGTNNADGQQHKQRHAESRRQAHKQSQRHRQPPPQRPLAGAGSAAPDSLFVDLHGLHTAEAVSVLESQIEEARAVGCRFLRVCTGTGHHTKGAKTPARLPAAVADALLSNHLTFTTLEPGLLEARL